MVVARAHDYEEINMWPEDGEVGGKFKTSIELFRLLQLIAATGAVQFSQGVHTTTCPQRTWTSKRDRDAMLGVSSNCGIPERTNDIVVVYA